MMTLTTTTTTTTTTKKKKKKKNSSFIEISQNTKKSLGDLLSLSLQWKTIF